MSQASPAKKITGVRGLGKALGVSHVTAGNYIKHPDWPYGKGPWTARQIAEMKQWASETLRPANESGPMDEERANVSKLLNKAKFKKIIRETELLEIRAKIMNGDFVDRAIIEAETVRKLETVKRNIRAVPAGLPFDQTIKAEVLRHIDRVFDLLSR